MGHPSAKFAALHNSPNLVQLISTTAIPSSLEFDEFSLDFELGSHHNVSNSLNNTVNNHTSPSSGMEAHCIGHVTSIHLYTFIIVGLLTGLMCMFGLIGNLLSTIVLVKTKLSRSVNLLLLGLTFCDTIVIFYAFLAFVLPPFFGYLNTGFWYTRMVFPLIAPFLLPLGYLGRTGSFYFTVAVTIERYIVVCWPLRAKIWCTSRRTIYFTFLVFIFTILYTLPKWFEIESWEVNENITQISRVGEDGQINDDFGNNSTIFHCYALRLTPLSQNATYQFCFNFAYLLVMGIFPFTVLVVLNLLIYKEIKWSNISRQSITHTQITENSIAFMLLCVVVIFFICATPATLLHILDGFSNISYHRLLIDTSLFLVTTNSCVNFAIYYICGKTFRNNFIMIWNNYFPCCPILNGLRSMGGSTTLSKSVGRTDCELI